MLKKGDRIQVKASESLGTPAVMGTIRSVEAAIGEGLPAAGLNYYIVHCDGDAPEWSGPVALDGTVMSDMPGNSLMPRMRQV